MDNNQSSEAICERTAHGWLRPYLVILDQQFSKRWDYWLRTLDAGQILEEPIPQIRWSGQGHRDARKNLDACLAHCRDRFPLEAFHLFVDWLLFGFGDPLAKDFPPQVSEELNAAWYTTFNLGLFLQHPHDYLGDVASELIGRSNPTAYFPTPMTVCVMMAQMTMQEAEKTSSVCDPCVGSGRLLMTASNISLNLFGVDIDARIIKVCKANMWMYVPWGVVKPDFVDLRSVSTPIEQGNTLTIPPIQKTTPEAQKALLAKNGQLSLF